MFTSLTNWKIHHKVIAQCFDTTSSNTGWISGAAILLEKHLNHPLLYLSCRHHISELYLHAACKTVYDYKKGETLLQCEMVKDSWQSIDHSEYTTLVLDGSWEAELKKTVINFRNKCLKDNNQPRADYKELLMLTLLVLGQSQSSSIKAPGAYSKARWMAIAIYTLRIFIFQKQLTFAQTIKGTIVSLTKFIVLIYTKY